MHFPTQNDGWIGISTRISDPMSSYSALLCSDELSCGHSEAGKYTCRQVSLRARYLRRNAGEHPVLRAPAQPRRLRRRQPRAAPPGGTHRAVPDGAPLRAWPVLTLVLQVLHWRVLMITPGGWFAATHGASSRTRLVQITRSVSSSMVVCHWCGELFQCIAVLRLEMRRPHTHHCVHAPHALHVQQDATCSHPRLVMRLFVLAEGCSVLVNCRRWGTSGSTTQGLCSKCARPPGDGAAPAACKRKTCRRRP